jgi:hypothetical protein
MSSTQAQTLAKLWPDMAAAISKAKSPALANRWLEDTRALLQSEPVIA